MPGFLDLPDRPAKPRRTGLTHVLDPGAGRAATADLLDSAAAHIDIWKVGWGTAYVDRALPAKLALLAEHARGRLPGRHAAGDRLGAGPGRGVPGLGARRSGSATSRSPAGPWRWTCGPSAS